MTFGLKIDLAEFFDVGAEHRKAVRDGKGCSKLDIVSDYVVLDLETTGFDPEWDEIIEIAAIKVRNKEEVEIYNTLVKPEIEIDEYIKNLTGITNEMVSDAPRIEKVLPKLIEFIGQDVVIGHNVNFDINFIYDKCIDCLDYKFSNNFIDTMRIARRLYPEEKHNKLNDLEIRFGLKNDNAHRALSDARLTNQCYLYMANYIAEKGINLRALNSQKSSKGLSAKDITTTNTEFDKSSFFYQKVFAFTGTLERMDRREAMQLVTDLGGICGDGVTKKTNYLILGNNDYCSSIKNGKSSKQRKAEEYKLKGQDIEIISENVFYDMLDEYYSNKKLE